MTAPLVDAGQGPGPSQGHEPAHAPTHGEPQFVGYDPHGTPLFVTPGAHQPMPHAHQYPAPARPPAHDGPLDPALTGFRPRTPLTAHLEQSAAGVSPAPPPLTAHAHA